MVCVSCFKGPVQSHVLEAVDREIDRLVAMGMITLVSHTGYAARVCEEAEWEFESMRSLINWSEQALQSLIIYRRCQRSYSLNGETMFSQIDLREGCFRTIAYRLE